MQITEEQRKRAEANRIAALEKRRAAAAKGSNQKPNSESVLPGQQHVKAQRQQQGSGEGNGSSAWNLFPCRKIIANQLPPKNVSQPQRASGGGNGSNAWNLFPCRKIIANQPPPKNVSQPPSNQQQQHLTVVLELCSPTEFTVSTAPAPGSTAEGRQEPLTHFNTFLSSVSRIRCVDSEENGSNPIYSLKDYEIVLKALKKLPGIQLQQIPWTTLAVIRQSAHSSSNKEWAPTLPDHLSDDEVDRLLQKLPRKLKEELLPFQWDGVRFGLRRGGRCLIADEMGVGKTVQAIAIASCYIDEGPILVVCPASMRFTWAEELERWLPFCPPADIHLVFGHQNNPSDLAKCPKIVVVSYTMLSRLQKSMLAMKWGLMIVDESHNLRCTKKMTECDETKAVLDVARTVKHIVLLSGTPSLSRPYDIFHQIDMLWPGLLGKDKYEFARNYCSMKSVQVSQGRCYKDFSKGIRLQELNVLLRETIMVRRLKQNVLAQLPPKRRQVIRLMLSSSDISLAKASTAGDERRAGESVCHCGFTSKGSCDCEDDDNDYGSGEFENLEDLQDAGEPKKLSKTLSHQEVGLAKLRNFQEWLFNHPLFADSEYTDLVDKDLCPQKMVVFGHHLRVLDGIQAAVCQKGLEFVRIDGSTLSKDRQAAVQAFRSKPEVKMAIIGITAGGVGLDFSTAQSVAFVELPKSASEMIQAEDRAHRRGQKNAINIYVFCAKDTSDETQWRTLNKSLERISTMMNGIDDCIHEIEVDAVYDLNLPDKPLCDRSMFTEGNKCDGYLKGSVPVLAMENNIIDDGKSDLELSKSSSQPLPNTDSYAAENSSVKNQNAQSGDECVPGTEIITCGLEGHGFLKGCADDNCVLEHAESCSQHLSNIESDAGENFCIKNEHVELDDGCALGSGQVTCGLVAESEGDSIFDIPPESLLFEVSANTGRIHLYACVSNKDSRPRQLALNFRPEDVEPPVILSSPPKIVHESPAHREAILTFIKEWNELRPIERNKIFGRPLRLPLCLELSCIKSEPHYTFEGLLKGGSKRRVAPKDEISDPLPENAIWQKVFLRKRYKMKERYEMQAWTAEGQPLCKLCQNPCLGIHAKDPEYFEDLFCKLNCFEVYRMRTSQRFMREVLFSVEHGICAHCKLDCHKLVKCIRPLSNDQRREHILKAAPDFANHRRLLDKLVLEPTEGNAWHADHIVPVYRGGGECRLENMRTLCVICHSKVTAEQQTDRRLMRARAKQGLQITIEKLIEQICQKRMKLYSQDSPCAVVDDSTEIEDDKELIMDISGSAYSKNPIGVQLDPSETEDDKELIMNVSGSAYSKKLTCVRLDSNDPNKIDNSEEGKAIKASEGAYLEKPTLPNEPDLE